MPSHPLFGIVKLCFLLLALMTAACAGESIPDPENAVDISHEPVVEEARDYWLAAGLPDVVETCEAPLWAEVTPERFQDLLGYTVCDHEGCVGAITTTTDSGKLVTFYAPGSGLSIDFIRGHEMMHALSLCAFGTLDSQHTRAAVWHDAMHWISERWR
jgi:hypothetical protein